LLLVAGLFATARAQTEAPSAAQERAAEGAIDPREAIRCGTFYLMGSEKHKGEKLSEYLELAARSLLLPAQAKVGEKQAGEWTDEFLQEFLKVPKEGGKFDAYLKDLRDRCEPLMMRAVTEYSGKSQTPVSAEKPKKD
jgi:hypothetical protein